MSVRSFAISARLFRRTGAWLRIFALIVLAGAAAAPSAADARAVRAGGAFDGNWNVVFVTRAGNCSSTNSAPFIVSGTRLISAGGGKVTGGVSPAGYVSVRISLGLSAASGTGRLVGNSGAGRGGGTIWGGPLSGTFAGRRGR